MSLLDQPHHDGSPLLRLRRVPAPRRPGDRAGADRRPPIRSRRSGCGRRTTPSRSTTRCAATTEGDTTWWSGELPVHNPVTHYRFLIVRPTPATDAATAARRPGVAHRAPASIGIDVPDATDFRHQRLRRRAGLGPRRRGLPGLPRPLRPLGGRGRPAHAAVGGGRGLGRRGRLRGPRPAHPAAALRRGPRRPHRAPRPRRGGGRRHRLHDPGLPRREQPPLQRDHLRPRRPAARRRRGLRSGSRPPCTPAAGGSSATSPPTTPATPTSGSPGPPPTRPARRGPTTTSSPTAPTRAGWATTRCPRSTTATPSCARPWSRVPTRWSGAGCVRRTTSTAGASTSPT